MRLTELPIDIIVLIFPYLNAKDFLAFTSSHPYFTSYRQDSLFWQRLTFSTFRIPPQPLLEGDGAHWQRLYKNIATQAHVYTWGSNSSGNLGHSRPTQPRGRRIVRTRRTCGWPQEMVETDRIGVIADVQCGGWSTVLLSATGILWAAGVLNGQIEFTSAYSLVQLKFPPAWPATSAERYEPSTAIQQFSVGRYRALALSDDHKIWEWLNFNDRALMVKFFTLDTQHNVSSDGRGKVTKVVAGWTKSSAYVLGTGIIYWSAQPSGSANTDAHIIEHDIVPGTAYQRSHPRNVASDSQDISIGEVTEYVFLEDYIVFITHLGKLFAWSTDNADGSHRSPFELSEFYDQSRPCIRSVQGSFRRFGVFTTSGKVLIGAKENLEQAWARANDLPIQTQPARPISLHALQNSGVISLAFGDHHWHALHANGSITSYGAESLACGSLGLGDSNISHLRGVYFVQRNTGDGELKIPEWSDGRRTVWFEEEKQQWLFDTCQKGATNEASPRALRLVQDPPTAELIGEWFEREGREWNKGPNGSMEDPEDDGIEPYFALKVSAAGHSSAALVLVDKEKAARVRRKYVVSEPEVEPGDSAASVSRLRESHPQTVADRIVNAGMWLLGFSSPDIRETQQSERERADVDTEEAERARAEEIRYNSTYVWDEQGFPRLRYPNGELMPGEIPETLWKRGQPDFTALTATDNS